MPMTPIDSLHHALRGSVAFTFLLLAACGNQEPQAAPIPSTPLTAVQTPPPVYPLELACAGIQGTSVLQVTVDAKGVPSVVTVAHSSGNAQLDQSAVTAVKSWVFEPATRGGQPVTQSLQVPVNFRLPAVRPDECFQLDGRK